MTPLTKTGNVEKDGLRGEGLDNNLGFDMLRLRPVGHLEMGFRRETSY